MNIHLMHKDTIVCNIDTWEVFNSILLPYGIAGGTNNIDTNIIYKWLNKRAMPLNRKNSDKIYKAAGLGRVGQERDLMILTHGLSINDNYWLADDTKEKHTKCS